MWTAWQKAKPMPAWRRKVATQWTKRAACPQSASKTPETPASERLLSKGLATMSRKIKKRSGRSRARTRPPRKVARRGKQQAQGEVSHCDRSQLSDSLSSDDLDCIVQETGIPEELRCFARQSVDIAVHLLESRSWDRDDRRRELVRATAKELARLAQDLENAIYEARDLIPALKSSGLPMVTRATTVTTSIDLFGLMSILDDFGDRIRTACITSEQSKCRTGRPARFKTLHSVS